MQVLKRNKSRTFLTGLAVASGVFILMVAMSGFNIFYNGSFGDLAQSKNQSVFLETLPTTKAYDGFSSGREWDLHMSDIDLVKEEFKSILNYVGPVYVFKNGLNIQLEDGRTHITPVTATNSDCLDVLSLSFPYGRYLNKWDMNGQRKVCVIGKQLSEKWFGPTVNPCGKRLLIDGVSFTIIGVSKKSNGFYLHFGNEENQILIPYTTADAIFNLEGKQTDMIYSIPATPGYEERSEQILRAIRQANNVDPDDTDAVLAEGMQTYAIMVGTVFHGIDILFWVVFLGVIITSMLGVFGIMMLSVKERKAEIGIRLTMGAVPQDIEKQFICESLVVTIISAIAGMLAAESVVGIMRKLFSDGQLADPMFGVPQLPLAGTVIVFVIIIIGSTLAGYIPSKKMTDKTFSELFND